MGKHTSHQQIIHRLKRASGHLASVIALIEAQEPCTKVAQQLHAVSNAIYNAKQEFIKDHISHCLNAEDLADANGIQASLDEFKEITKYLD